MRQTIFFTDLCYNSGSCIFLDVGNNNLCSLLRIKQCNLPADTRARTRNECNLMIQSQHCILLMMKKGLDNRFHYGTLALLYQPRGTLFCFRWVEKIGLSMSRCYEC